MTTNLIITIIQHEPKRQYALLIPTGMHKHAAKWQATQRDRIRKGEMIMNEIITNYGDLVLLIPPSLGLALIIILIVKR